MEEEIQAIPGNHPHRPEETAADHGGTVKKVQKAQRRRTAPFTQIATAALRDVNLSLKAKGLLGLMLSRHDDWNFYMQELQKHSRDGREATQSAMDELLEHGYCVRTAKRAEHGRLNGWLYTVTDCPEPRPVDAEDDGEAGGRLDRQTAQPSDGAQTPTKKDLIQNEVQSSAAGAPGGGETLGEHLNPGPPDPAKHAAACQLLQNAFQDIRMSRKGKVIDRQASEALAAGFRPSDLDAALQWAQKDSWWKVRLVPNNLNEMLPRWDATRDGVVPADGSLQSPSADTAQPQPVDGERRQAPTGQWRTVAEVADGHVFWTDDSPEIPVHTVIRWPVEAAE